MDRRDRRHRCDRKAKTFYHKGHQGNCRLLRRSAIRRWWWKRTAPWALPLVDLNTLIRLRLS